MNKKRGFESPQNTMPDAEVARFCSNRDEASSGSANALGTNVKHQGTSSCPSSLIGSLDVFEWNYQYHN